MALAEMCVWMFDYICAFACSVSDEQAWTLIQVLCKAVFVDDCWSGFGDLAVGRRSFASLRMTRREYCSIDFHTASIDHRDNVLVLRSFALLWMTKRLCYEGVKCADCKKEAGCITIDTKAFNEKVAELANPEWKYLGDKPAIIDFNATWCGPCRRIAPILDELAQEYDGQIVIYKVDVDKCPDIAEAFGIQSIPAVLYIPVDGEPQMTIGSRSKTQFQQEIEKILLKK